MAVSKDRGKTPKMDGENNGKSYFLMDDLGGKTPIFGNIHMYISNFKEKTSARPLDLLFPDLHTMTDVAYKAWPQRHEKSYFGDLAGKKEKGYPSVEEMALFLSRKCILIMMVFQNCHWVHRVHQGKSKFWTSEKLTFTAVFHRFPSQNPQPHHGLNLDRMVLHRIYHWHQHGSLTSKLGFLFLMECFPSLKPFSPPIGWWCHRHPPRSTAPGGCSPWKSARYLLFVILLRLLGIINFTTKKQKHPKKADFTMIFSNLRYVRIIKQWKSPSNIPRLSRRCCWIGRIKSAHASTTWR